MTLGEFAVGERLAPPCGRPARCRQRTASWSTSGCAQGRSGPSSRTSGDWGPPLVVTRVAGTSGTAWIEGVGSVVKVADRNGTRTIPVADDLPTATGPPLPEGLVRTRYEQMISHGMDFGSFTRLAEFFGCRIDGKPDPPGPAPGTFADGVADIAVVDAVRASAAAGGAWTVVLSV